MLVEMVVKLNQRMVSGMWCGLNLFFEFDVKTTGCQSNVT